MERAELETEIARLERMAKARRGKSGFSQNVSDIDARLAELRAELAADGN